MINVTTKKLFIILKWLFFNMKKLISFVLIVSTVDLLSQEIPQDFF